MVVLELTDEQAELVKKGLEIVSEQIDDAHDTCWNLINEIESLQNEIM